MTKTNIVDQLCEENSVADISNLTGLRKTNFSEVLYDELIPEIHRIKTILPRTPQPRRKSIDNSNVPVKNTTAFTLESRQIPIFKSSMTKSTSTSHQDISGTKENTWNGRSIGATKKRPSLATDTFQVFYKNTRNASLGEIERPRWKKNVNTSPMKPSSTIKDQKQSLLAQQLLETAGNNIWLFIAFYIK